MERLLTLTNVVRKATFVFFAFLMFTTLIILITITHFKVALKKEEIELFRLLGASNFYIKKPFLLEAVFFGFICAISAFSVFLTSLLYLNSFFNSFLNGISKLEINLGFYQLNVWPINLNFLILIFIAASLFGILTSTLASYLATQKYIK